MSNKITWPELLTLAKTHYNDGGDGVVECWTEADFDEYTAEFGPMTKADALQMFGTRSAVLDDLTADANSYREEATQDTETDKETESDWWSDWIADTPAQEWDDGPDEWRPGDAPWKAPGMSVSDFIR